MNNLVAKWKRYESRAKPVALDSVSIDEDKFVMVQGTNREKFPMPDPKSKTRINKGALIELILFGSKESVDQVKTLVDKTLARLKIRRLRRVKPFTKTGWYKGGRPSTHRILWWLNGLDADNPNYTEDIEFLKKISVTIAVRDFTPPEDDE